MSAPRNAAEHRVLVLTPSGRDAPLAAGMLARGGVEATTCGSLDALIAAIPSGAGAVLIAAEALTAPPAMAQLGAVLDRQPSWSALPVIVLTHARARPPGELEALRRLEQFHSVTFLERPVRAMTLISTLRVALQSRRRQYQTRDLLSAGEQAVKQRDAFLAMLAHELRNPLAPIRNAVHLLQLRSAELPPDLGWASSVVERQLAHLTHLVDDLLDVARITRGKIELQRRRVDLRKILDQALEAAQPTIRDATQHLEVVRPAQPLYAEADPTRMAQVMGNLLHNASKYTDAGGTLTVTLGEEHGEAVFSVRDTGMGIAPEHLDHVFELFTQGAQALHRPHGGLGLGLTLVHSLVRMHGGRVSAHSEGPGRGSEFVVRLPREGAGVAPAEGPAPPLPGKVRRILVTDDNPDVAKSFAMLLSALGHEVATAFGGHDALEEAARLRPDIVFLDLGMPEMDGFAVARGLRAMPGGKDVVLVALTGYGDPQTHERVRAAGFDHHLLKPADLQAVERILTDLRETPIDPHQRMRDSV